MASFPTDIEISRSSFDFFPVAFPHCLLDDNNKLKEPEISEKSLNQLDQLKLCLLPMHLNLNDIFIHHDYTRSINIHHHDKRQHIHMFLVNLKLLIRHDHCLLGMGKLLIRHGQVRNHFFRSEIEK